MNTVEFEIGLTQTEEKQYYDFEVWLEGRLQDEEVVPAKKVMHLRVLAATKPPFVIALQEALVKIQDPDEKHKWWLDVNNYAWSYVHQRAYDNETDARKAFG